MLHFIEKYFGWRNWSVLVYNSVIENMFLVFYIALSDQLYSLTFIADFFIFLLFSSFCTTYGYLVNDLADKELDILHGKENTFKGDSNLKAVCIVFSFLLLSILTGLHFINNPLFLPLWLSWFLIATAYSIKPIRLKERGKVGLIFVVIAQRILPALLIFSAFRHYNWVDMVVFATYILFRGLSSELNHQLEDYHKDSATNTDTYAVQAGLKKGQKIFRLSLESEKFLLFICLLLIYNKLSHIEFKGLSLILPILVLYFFLYGLSWIKIMRQGIDIDINPFSPGRKDIFQFIHHTFPSVVLAFYLLLLLAYKKWLFIPIVFLFVILRKLYSLELIRNSFPVRVICNITKNDH